MPSAINSPVHVTVDRLRDLGSSALIRREGRDPAVVGFETAVVSFFVDAAEILGIPKSLAAIYGICFASADPLSFADIEQKLDISKGSISQGLRVLRGVGALKEVSCDADRVELFEPDIELRKLILHYLEQRVEKQLEAGKKRIREIKASIPRNDPRASKNIIARVKSLDAWHTKSRAILPLIKGALRVT